MPTVSYAPVSNENGKENDPNGTYRLVLLHPPSFIFGNFVAHSSLPFISLLGLPLHITISTLLSSFLPPPRVINSLHLGSL